jgi:hypothetical protein
MLYVTLFNLEQIFTYYFQELTFHPDIRRKEGFKKLQGACDRALQDGLSYIWIDTCCIDKDSSAELSEAINSMYKWYKDSSVCYVYLHDIAHDIDQNDLVSALDGAEWFKRGWTLQELIAPATVFFFAKNWSRIGSKATWVSPLHEITHIRKEVLLGIPYEPSIAETMSWAVGRKTQKIEDRAYSLMGLFKIHMAIIYGEGEKAFRRLQLEIMKSSDDQTIFAWQDSLDYPHLSRRRGLLASTPDVFVRGSPSPLVNIEHSRFVHCLTASWRSSSFRDLEHGYVIRNGSIHMTLPMKQDGDSWLAVLKCKTEDQELPYGIYLHEMPDSTFLRSGAIKLHQLGGRDFEGLVPKKICMMIDHHVPPTSPRRRFFTLRSPDISWDRCSYFICPNPEDNSGHQGSGRQALVSDTQIELEDNMQCGCVCYEGRDGKVAVLMGIEHHRPWIHLITKPDLYQFVDTGSRRPRDGTEDTRALYTSQLTSEPSQNDAGPISPTSPTSQAPTRPAGHSNHSNSQRRTRSFYPAPALLRPRTGCPVCTLIRQGGMNIREIKDGMTDLLTGTVAGKEIEVDVRMGRTCTFEPELEVEYVITVTVD